jgi:hypothetical protein
MRHPKHQFPVGSKAVAFRSEFPMQSDETHPKNNAFSVGSKIRFSVRLFLQRSQTRHPKNNAFSLSAAKNPLLSVRLFQKQILSRKDKTGLDGTIKDNTTTTVEKK